MAKIDLKSAYRMVSVHPDDRKDTFTLTHAYRLACGRPLGFLQKLQTCWNGVQKSRGDTSDILLG